MNRRRFIQSLAAIFTLPAGASLPLPTVAAAAPAAAAVPANARFWAIYISALHGECTPQTLQNMLHIPEGDAKRYIGQLITDGVIKPNPLLQNSVSNLLKSKDESLLDKAKNRLKKKTQAQSGEPGISESDDDAESLESDPQLMELEEAGTEPDESLNGDQDDDIGDEHAGEDATPEAETEAKTSPVYADLAQVGEEPVG